MRSPAFLAITAAAVFGTVADAGKVSQDPTDGHKTLDIPKTTAGTGHGITATTDTPTLITSSPRSSIKHYTTVSFVNNGSISLIRPEGETTQEFWKVKTTSTFTKDGTVYLLPFTSYIPKPPSVIIPELTEPTEDAAAAATTTTKARWGEPPQITQDGWVGVNVTAGHLPPRSTPTTSGGIETAARAPISPRSRVGTPGLKYDTSPTPLRGYGRPIDAAASEPISRSAAGAVVAALIAVGMAAFWA